MTASGESAPLYKVEWNGQDDYLPDEALHVIERLLTKLPNGFDLRHHNATARSVTATIRFDGPGDPVGNAERFEAMLQAVTVVRTLHANLVAARAALSAGEGRSS